MGRKDHYASLEWKVIIYFPSLERKHVIYLSINLICIKNIFENYDYALLEGDQVKQKKVQRANAILLIKISADSV